MNFKPCRTITSHKFFVTQGGQPVIVVPMIAPELPEEHAYQDSGVLLLNRDTGGAYLSRSPAWEVYEIAGIRPRAIEGLLKYGESGGRIGVSEVLPCWFSESEETPMPMQNYYALITQQQRRWWKLGR